MQAQASVGPLGNSQKFSRQNIPVDIFTHLMAGDAEGLGVGQLHRPVEAAPEDNPSGKKSRGDGPGNAPGVLK